MIDRPGEPLALVVAVAVAAMLLPLGFVALVGGAAVARRRGAVLGTTLLRGIAFAGGLALGAMDLVVIDDPSIGLPFLVVGAVIAINEWRSGRRASAGWVIAGVALPWTLLWGAHLVLRARGAAFDPTEVIRAFAAGALPLAAGLILAGRYAAEPARPASGRTPPRSFRFVARAIREPSQIGAVPLPELAAVVAWAAVGLVAAFVPTVGEVVRFVIASVLGSALASEAYLRAMAPASRRAFEAFSWLGEQELAALRDLTRERVPHSSGAARSWLERHPLASDEPQLIRSLRIEMLLLAGRVEAARAAADDRPAPASADDRFAHAADRELVAWWADEANREQRLADLGAAAAAIVPSDGDARLRADVSFATAQLRERAVAGAPPLDVLAPLVDVRARLGARADGLVRRVLWRRIFGLFLACSVALELVAVVIGFVPPL